MLLSDFEQLVDAENLSCNLHNFADELLSEKEKYKSISEELDVTFAELTGY